MVGVKWKEEAEPGPPAQGMGHGARHLAGTSLQQAAVEKAITTEIQQTVAGSTATRSFWGKVVVDGQQVFYRAYTLANGTITVGTYTVGLHE
jgi:hypothetical protein